MIYFPSINKPFKNSLGTNFFKLKKNHKKNLDLWDSKLMDKQSADIFFDNYEIFYKSDFEKNKLVGFIKSKNSWHNVDLIDNDIERNSVNINFYLL